MHPDARVQNNKVKGSYRVVLALVGTDRLDACMEGEDPLSDMLTEEDMMVVIGTGEEPGFFASATAAQYPSPQAGANTRRRCRSRRRRARGPHSPRLHFPCSGIPDPN